MDVRGFIETSLLDWDGKISSVIFLPYCNFRCPFCDNGILLDQPESLPEIKWEKIEAFLRERKDFIDGVVISGGEPTIHLWLPQLAQNIKDLGLLVKLDTNGTHPAALSSLLTSGVLDYVAMDLKSSLSWHYREAAGTEVDLAKIKQSIRLILGSGIDHEFRTTMVPTLIGEEEVEGMAHAIAGAKKYALQQFVPDHTLDEKMRVLAPYSKEKMHEFAAIAKKHVPATIVRGV